MVGPILFKPLFPSRTSPRTLRTALAGAWLLAAAIPCLLATTSPGAAAPGISVAAQIGGDMQGENEGFPHGVPRSFDWASRPVIVMGNNSNGGRAIEAWGAVYQDVEAKATSNTRVNIRNMRTYLLEKSGKWVLLQNTSTPMGAAYHEDFSGDLNKPADVRSEPDGTISAVAGGGFNFHFYPVTRAAIEPGNIQGIVTLFEARLIVADPSKPDDRDAARFLCIAGADYYPALTGSWPGNDSFNPGVALGKMKYVRTEWRSFSMTTLNQSQLESNPPPIDLSGILP